jgi:hypothetical protein
MLTEACQNSGGKGRHLVSTQPFLQAATMKTRDLTTKIIEKKLTNTRNWSSRVKALKRQRQ